jgi:hypothetical protein
MTATISVNGLVGKWDLPAFKASSNENLMVAFDGLLMSPLYRYLATFVVGAAKKVITLNKDLTATVDSDFLNENGETLEVFLEARSAKTDKLLISADPQADGFFIEPLKLLRFDECITAVGMLREINARLDALENAAAATTATLAEFKDGGVPFPVQVEDESGIETVEE